MATSSARRQEQHGGGGGFGGRCVVAVESYLFAHAMSFRTYVSSDSSLRACLASRTITVAVATMRVCVGRIQKHGGAA